MLWPERRGKTVRRTDRETSLAVYTPALPDPLEKLVEGNLARWLLRKIGLSDLVGDGKITLGPIPKGTPVSLLANLNIDRTDPRFDASKSAKMLVAIKKKLKEIGEGADPTAVWTEPAFLAMLVANSTCPDFVVDRGHNFGGDLADADKEALIEFVKTF